MHETVNNFLLAGDKFMPEMHLKILGFTYSICGIFTQNKGRIQKLYRGRTGNNNNNKIKQKRLPLDLANLQLAEQLHQPIFRKFKKQKVYPGFKDNIWEAYLADM